MAEGASWDTATSELVDLYAFGDFIALTPSSDTCPLELSAQPVASRGKGTKCDVYVWKLQAGADPTPLAVASDSAVQQISGVVLTASTLLRPFQGGMQEVQTLVTWDGSTASQYFIRPSRTEEDAVEIMSHPVTTAI